MTFPISCVVVLFNPVESAVGLVRTLVSGGNGVVVVVNAADDSILRELRTIQSVSMLDNKENLGLATALNIGIRHAFEANGSEFVALFDQDSSPEAAMPRDLVTELQASSVATVACIGPILIDRKDVEARYASNDEPHRGDRPRSIPTSGTVISKAAYDAVGPMMDELFIDGIDHEWCFRARSKGFAVLVSQHTRMLHDMGDASLNYFGRYKPVHRSPVRHYYIVRNAIYLARLAYLPLRWRVIELLKTVRRIFAYLVVSSDRRRTFRLIAHAVGDGLAARMGACPWT
jgi:rhamnosyltransferase